MVRHPLTKYQKKIDAVAKKHGISYLALFGSYARGDQKKTSDIDLLVQYKNPIGIFHHTSSQLALEKIFGKSVDLISTNGISRLLRPFITKDIKVIYDQRPR